MSEMVERVAKAIYKAALEAARDADEYCSEYMAQVAARAAIEAMREPTEEMIEAGQLYVWQDGEPTAGPHAVQRQVFVAMIDAALKEPVEG